MGVSFLYVGTQHSFFIFEFLAMSGLDFLKKAAKLLLDAGLLDRSLHAYRFARKEEIFEDFAPKEKMRVPKKRTPRKSKSTTSLSGRIGKFHKKRQHEKREVTPTRPPPFTPMLPKKPKFVEQVQNDSSTVDWDYLNETLSDRQVNIT